jgi:pyruvate dehydrogenase E2 component (dihydrolipoamide acetyltransferase)
MIKEVRLPEIAENVESGDVIKVLVKVGDVIDVDQPLVELETDKAVLEVPSPFKGRVTEIAATPGATIKIGGLIARIETDVAALAGPKPTRTTVSPSLGPTAAARPSSPARETKTATEEPVTHAPAPAEKRGKAAPARPAAPPPQARPERQEQEQDLDPAPASPSLRRLARELGVNIHEVRGSGPGGRIHKDDLKSHARNVVEGAPKREPASAATEVTENTKWGPVVREPMSMVRRVTARVMTEAWTTIPHVTQFDTVDITEVDEIRKQYSRKVEISGGKLTLTAILIKVVASALKVFPQFNASIDMATSEIIYKRYYHVGVAVDTDRGLLVPVIRAVDKKNISELSQELNALAERARNKKLTPDEMEGGTFTISNLGGIGGTNFSPIINPPQVAILGAARARIEPVYRGTAFEPRLMLPVAVSYDHRIIDGADAARFLRWIAEAMEEPLLLALEG